MTREEVRMLREKYPPGTLLELTRMDGEPGMYKGLKGTVSSVDDIGQIHVNWENGSTLALNSELDSFSVADEAGPDEIRVLIVEPEKTPIAATISASLNTLQDIVEGSIEVFSPSRDDDAVIICNEEGKLLDLPLNRAIFDEENGELLDIIAGTFIVARAPEDSDTFESLTPMQEDKYKEMFREPERFVLRGRNITVDTIEEEEPER